MGEKEGLAAAGQLTEDLETMFRVAAGKSAQSGLTVCKVDRTYKEGGDGAVMVGVAKCGDKCLDLSAVFFANTRK